MEPLHVREQRSGMMKREVLGDLLDLRDVITLSSHQLLNCGKHFSSLSDAYNSTVVFP